MYENLTVYLPRLQKNSGEKGKKQDEWIERDIDEAIMLYVKDHPEFRQYYHYLEKAGIKWDMDSMSKANEKILFSETVVAMLVGAMRADRFCWGAFPWFCGKWQYRKMASETEGCG